MTWRGRLVLAAALVTLGLATSPARALDPRIEAVAKRVLERAGNDYLSTNYAEAITRLQKAVTVCGTTECTVGTRAALLRDLGTMQFRNGDLGAAKKTWTRALAVQKDIALNPDYDTPDLRAAWDQVKGGSAADVGSEGGPQPSGDFAHTPAAEQRVNTPLPVYAEFSGGGVVRVVVKYKGASANGWSQVNLKRIGSAWGGTIPCAEVTLGTMRYWIQGFDDGGDPVASSGDPKHSYTVPIREDISAEAPHLPDAPPPKQCGETDECTPGAPGCAGEAPHVEKEPTDAKAERGTGALGYARFWVGITGALDSLQLPAGDDLCGLTASASPANSAGYYCTNPNGSDFPSRQTAAQNDLLVHGQAGHVGGGFQSGDVRVLATFDYALSASFLLGARLGYVFETYPGQAAVSNGKAWGSKVHAEVRATYLFGRSPLSYTGFAPMVFFGAGLAEFDGHTSSTVTLANVAGPLPVNVWLTDGPFFATAGGGARYQFSPRAAFTAAARLNSAFGGNGVLLTYGPEFSVLYGF